MNSPYEQLAAECEPPRNVTMTEEEQLRAEIASWRLLCNLLRKELRKVRTDLIAAKNDLADLSCRARDAADRRPTQHPDHLPPEAMRFVENLFMSPSVAEQDRAAHPEEGNQP